MLPPKRESTPHAQKNVHKPLEIRDVDAHISVHRPGASMPKTYSSAGMTEIVTADGWFRVPASGGHLQFKHPTKPGRVTIDHPVRDMPIGTAKSVFAQAGLLEAFKAARKKPRSKRKKGK
jgi:predicted RNA binding protein YcfA (HicA-like mRNA interferase family)